MGGRCSTRGKMRTAEDLGVGRGRPVMLYIIRKYDLRVWSGFSWLRTRPSGGGDYEEFQDQPS